eukprot:9277456-Pyramimonas_sp.AAC.1
MVVAELLFAMDCWVSSPIHPSGICICKLLSSVTKDILRWSGMGGQTPGPEAVREQLGTKRPP